MASVVAVRTVAGKKVSHPRVAVVHDKFWQFGGGERVALALREIWPDADLYTSTYDPRIAQERGFGDVNATSLQKVPGLHWAHHYFLPLYDHAFRSLDFSGYDLVVSSSAMFAKSVRAPRGIPHICYCHTPPRFLWDLREELVAQLPRSRFTKLVVSTLAHRLRRTDHRAAARVTHFVANSAHVAERIAESYGREAKVVYPPVHVERPRKEFEQGEHAVAVARLYPYKRVDLAIDACNRLRLPLEVIGEGPDRPRLEALAGPTVRFRGWLPEEEKNRVVASARVLIAPQVEDFGIATVEAIALGTPVLALRRGGSVEIVEEGVSGSFFHEQSADTLVRSLRTFDENHFDRRAMQRSITRFAPERFVRSMREIAREAISG